MNSLTLQHARELFQAGQWPALLKTCKELDKQPVHHDEVSYMTGIALIQLNQLQEGISILENIIAKNPRDVNALNALAIGHERLHNFDSALKYYQKALKLVPGSIPLLTNIADLQRKMGKTKLAIALLKPLQKKHESDTNLLNTLALCYSDDNKYDEAQKLWEKILEISPNNPQVLNNLSILLYKTNKNELALEYVEKAYVLSPDHPNVLNNYGNCLSAVNEHEKAIPLFLRATELAPQFAEAVQNLAYAYHNIGDFDLAFKYYKQALNIAPDNKYPIWQRSMTNLLSGNFKQGWLDYEVGLELNERTQKTDPRPRWNPEINNEANVLVTLEQGIGDQIMFVSCLPDLQKVSSNIRLECEPRLAPLFQRSFPKVEVLPLANPSKVSKNKKGEATEYQLAMGSLPLLFRKKISDFPRKKSFLIADKALIEKWSNRFDNMGGNIKIGISWNAGVLVEHLKRSISLENWLPILQTEKCDFINLQYGKHQNCEEFKSLRDQYGINIFDWDDSDSYKNLDDFAAQITALDLVISVGNANVHLAGALGTPAWCMIPYVPSWRWMFNGQESVWYKSVKMYRQDKLNHWETVINQVSSDLKQLTLKK